MWQIKFSKNAAKSVKKLDNSLYKKIIKYLEQEDLLKNPKAFGKSLTGNKKGYWRYRVENYRIICKILDNELIVFIVDIGHGSDIYDK